MLRSAQMLLANVLCQHIRDVDELEVRVCQGFHGMFLASQWLGVIVHSITATCSP